MSNIPKLIHSRNHLVKMRLLSLFLIICFPIIASAQPGWLRGYIVTNASDTLYGKVYYTTAGQRSAKCLFKEDGYNDKVKYRPFTIKGYYVNKKYYISRIYDIHPSLTYGLGVFMEYINVQDKGPVMLLKYRNTDHEYGFFQTFLLRKGNPSYEINHMKFRKSVAAFFKDYKELHDDILAKKYKKRDLPEIVKRYNNWYKNK